MPHPPVKDKESHGKTRSYAGVFNVFLPCLLLRRERERGHESKKSITKIQKSAPRPVIAVNGNIHTPRQIKALFGGHFFG